MRTLSLALLTACTLFSLKENPWMGELFEFHFEPYYYLQHYPNVNNAINPSSYSSTDNFLGADLSVRFLPDWETLFETEWNTTKKHNMRFLSCALQVRNMVMDDIEGDPISFVWMGDIRYVPVHALRDVSTPYSGRVNFEIGASIGKEIDIGNAWAHTIYGYSYLGQANRGWPWIRGAIDYAAEYLHKHSFGFQLSGFFGFGRDRPVNVGNFDGWGRYAHQSIDLTALYKYRFPVWGQLTASYTRRLLAKNYPEDDNIFYLSYNLPFALF